MIASLLLFVAAQAGTIPTLGPIGEQSLPARGCAAYLWNAADRQLIAMAVAEPATIRLAIDSKTRDFARASEDGLGTLGFPATTRYAGGDVVATLAMSVVARENLTAGAQVPSGTLTIDQAGHDSVVLPIAGLVGCAS